YVYMPAENRMQSSREHCVVDGGVRPAPESLVGLAVSTEQIPRDNGWLRDSQCQAFSFHAVLHGQHALFEQLALHPVGFLYGVLRDSAGLLGEGQIRIAGLIGRLHGDIAGERGGDPELLLLPIDIGDAVGGWRFDQPAQPYTRAEYELGIA